MEVRQVCGWHCNAFFLKHQSGVLHIATDTDMQHIGKAYSALSVMQDCMHALQGWLTIRGGGAAEEGEAGLYSEAA